ncbi:sugar transferase [Micrococcus luteus]|uniref:sugar transferase n=1 Tax=Micrococcus luteus TaxID=1270 RepID=UPI003F4D36D4
MQIERVEKRVTFFVKNWEALTKSLSIRPNVIRPIGLAKRAFDIFFASSALIILFPLLLIVALAIWMESKGPVFYYSLRAGTGFKVFKFYKFRSMYVDADKKVKDGYNGYQQGLKSIGPFPAGQISSSLTGFAPAHEHSQSDPQSLFFLFLLQ